MMTLYKRLQEEMRSVRVAKKHNCFLPSSKNNNYQIYIPINSITYNIDYVRTVIRKEFNLKTRIIENDFSEKYLVAF